jgi:ADP-heptose:LPS heptosyltransferase
MEMLRSFPLKELYENVKHLDADFYLIDKNSKIEYKNDFPNLINISNDIESWEDTFGILDNLDFVISSCTSVVHAAGSSGCKTFAVVPLSPYYIWRSEYEHKSYWYGDNVTVLRQKQLRSWKEPLEQLKTFLKEYE